VITQPEYLYLVAEDTLGLAVGRKLVAEVPLLAISRADNAHGSGNLRRNAPKYNKMGYTMPVFMLTDLDNRPCPTAMISDWLDKGKLSPKFFFRVCVRELEAWLLAHKEAIAFFLQISETLIPSTPENLSDPKAKLINLAQKSPRKIREGLTPIGSATIGPRYNEILGRFVQDTWNPGIAEKQAPSLARARVRLASLASICNKE
jgi:hypothetical protein